MIASEKIEFKDFGFNPLIIQIGIIFLLFCGFNTVSANNGIVIGWHTGTSNSWSQTELGITPNLNRQLSVTSGGPLYGTSGAGEPVSGADWAYSLNWNSGSGTKGWVFPMTTTGFRNLTISFYQKSRIQLGTYGPRDFKLQYSTNGSTWTDVSGANFVLTANWQKFTASLPAACSNQPALYLKWVMSSNVSIGGGSIDPTALSDFSEFKMYGDEDPLPITAMSLSCLAIAHNQPSGTTVGTLSYTDANYYDTHTISLVSGAGDTDNGKFRIEGTTLKTAAVLSPGSYSVRVQVSDGTYTLESSYTIRSSAYPIVTVGDPTWNSDAYISRVQFGSIDNISGMSGENNSLAYTDYSVLSADVIPGSAYTLTIKAQVINSYGENIRVYIDWNHDYDLTDEGEKTDLLTGSHVTGLLTASANITVPAGAAIGSTLMRVVIDNGQDLALGGSDYGEVEDYTLNIKLPAVTFAGGSSFVPPVIIPGNPDQVLGRFKLTADNSGAALTGVSIKLNGARTGLSNLKLWSSTNDTFGGDTQLGSVVASDPGTGNSVLFSFASPVTTTGVYYFLTGNIASGASGNAVAVLVQNSSLTISGGNLSGTISNATLTGNDSPLPVELSSFAASSEGGRVILKWKTATEVNNFGFEIERWSVNPQNSEFDSWACIGFVHGSGSNNSAREYSFTDDKPLQGRSKYRIKQIDNNGFFRIYDAISVNVESPEEFRLLQNSPNPFNPSTAIKFELPVNALVSIKIYDQIGREVTTLIDREIPAGPHVIYWNGCDRNGMAVSSGIYLYRLSAGNYVETRKMNLLR